MIQFYQPWMNPLVDGAFARHSSFESGWQGDFQIREFHEKDSEMKSMTFFMSPINPLSVAWS
jgi:hypothetical protein